jgi:putative oxidoreductase
MGVATLAVAILGPGKVSLDNAFGIVHYDNPSSAGLLGTTGGLIAFIGGVGAAALLLATSWRPSTVKKPEDANT